MYQTRLLPLLPLLLLLPLLPLEAQTASIAGTVSDSVARTPLAGAVVEARRGPAPISRAVSGNDGTFRVERLPAGTYVVTVSRIGYGRAVLEGVVVRDGATTTLRVALAARALELNPEVVTASRHEEKALDAPAAVSVITRQDVAAQPSLTTADHVIGLPGVDVVTSGLTQHNVVTRGFNNAGSGQLLVLTDNRYAAVPSLRINAYNFIPLTDADIERIEIVRGPGAALYGPNATAGVMHIITRSPFDSRGTIVSVAGGNRSLFQADARYAGVVGSRLGWKISGQYVHANDFGYIDPIEQSSRAAALSLGANADTLLIGRRDSVIERLAGEARIDFRAGPRTTLIGSVGVNDALNNVDITGFGAAQVHGWRYQYAQLRLVRPNLFAQVYYDGSDAGASYMLNTGQRLVDRSRMIVGQFQDVLHPAPWETLTWGVDAQRTDPRTGGTIFGRYEQNDLTDEAGAYLHSETRLAGVELVGALRVDHHNRVAGVALSPRAAVVAHPTPGSTLRLTYNRAFSTPTSYDMFLDLLFAPGLPASLPGVNLTLPFPVRAMGVPQQSGFTFRRDCGGALDGLCMHSPFAPPSLGGPTQSLPADATLLWPSLVDALKLFGYDLSAIPPPTAAQVGSTLQRLDIGTKTFEPTSPSDVTDLAPLGFNITNTLELGYQGLIAQRLAAELAVYHSWYHGFTASYVATPNVFFDAATLRAYLTPYVGAVSAAQLASVISQVPVGTVSPEQAFDPNDILVVSRNFGQVSLWGVDAAATLALASGVTLTGTYSWVSHDLFPNLGGIADVALNAPQHKASLAVGLHNARRGLDASVRTRYVDGFPVISGAFGGQVQSYAVTDADVSWRLPFASQMTLSVSGWNLIQAQEAVSGGWQLVDRHREFASVPALGRVVMTRLRVAF
jgi:outer membrane receptor for ferrienterochelin and colicins